MVCLSIWLVVQASHKHCTANYYDTFRVASWLPRTPKQRLGIGLAHQITGFLSATHLVVLCA